MFQSHKELMGPLGLWAQRGGKTVRKYDLGHLVMFMAVGLEGMTQRVSVGKEVKVWPVQCETLRKTRKLRNECREGAVTGGWGGRSGPCKAPKRRILERMSCRVKSVWDVASEAGSMAIHISPGFLRRFCVLEVLSLENYMWSHYMVVYALCCLETNHTHLWHNKIK